MLCGFVGMTASACLACVGLKALSLALRSCATSPSWTLRECSAARSSDSLVATTLPKFAAGLLTDPTSFFC
eukprot:10712213-Prorocentrum_lima.AAC.1